MNGLAIYAWYVAPLLALAFCFGVYALASRERDHTPAE